MVNGLINGPKKALVDEIQAAAFSLCAKFLKIDMIPELQIDLLSNKEMLFFKY